MSHESDVLNLIVDLLQKAKKSGAESADAVMVESLGVSMSRRLGQPETVERDESRGVGLRVLKGKRQAFVSSSDVSAQALEELVERAVAMASVSPEDPYVTLADEDVLAKDTLMLDLYDGQEPDAEELADMARRAEETALAVSGVTNSEGADASYGTHTFALATTNGFAESYRTSSSSLSVSVLAGEGTQMERDYEYSVARHFSDLMAPEDIGRIAGERTIRRLNPRKVSSCEVPVVFDPRVGRSLLSSFASAINGAAVARKTSFLKDKMGQQVFNAVINVVDDPHRQRGLGSKPFDAEGVAGKKRYLAKDGVLTTWLLDLRSAKQLELSTTGHATRGMASPPSPSSTNLYIENGKISPKEMMADIKSGFYVTETFGMGINTITGDYSQGANGFWIENGVISYPVSEITIAGNLNQMFAQMLPANDLEFKYGTNAPTLYVERMTIAGT